MSEDIKHIEDDFQKCEERTIANIRSTIAVAPPELDQGK